MTALISSSPIFLGFAASALLFDLLMPLTHHDIQAKILSVVVTAMSAAISAYVAGAIIGVFFMNKSAEW